MRCFVGFVVRQQLQPSDDSHRRDGACGAWLGPPRQRVTQPAHFPCFHEDLLLYYLDMLDDAAVVMVHRDLFRGYQPFPGL